ncbi:CalY family protein [Couchioplanes caeruleus]|uniref:CalY family protein n=1 Tax=Couchioplanes caeruleus TaxID=56438 RepID=UPI0020BDE102|nr:CalY family protein [Couchioplanes caeruleus]UQU65750.1 CalY family protein [Couchioplanes caeruleus]
MQLAGMKMVAVGLTVAGGIAVSSGVMWQASSAAFTASTGTAANSWNAGTVVLSDDDSAVAMFNATNLRPGSTGDKCITVSYTGSLSSTVKMYGTAVSGALTPYVDLVIEEGSGGGFGSCTGFTPSGTAYTGTLANFGSTKTGFATGVGTFAPSGSGQQKTYHVTYTVNAATPDTAQAASAAATFTWEANS